MDERSKTKIISLEARPQQDTAALTPALVVVQGEEIGRRYALDAGKRILGRDSGQADLVIRDESVSGKHVMIQCSPEAGRFGLVDLGSLNGTLLNGHKVESAALRDGDKIFIGETVLKFTLHDAIEEDYHRQVNHLMHVDSLTGLYMRRWFDSEYPKAFELARRSSSELCVLMLDMDGLKAINDQHGHQLGSYCISETGKMIKELIEGLGMGSRFGGDEFVIFLHCNLEDATDVAERIRVAIDRFEFRKGEIRVAPTISIGVARLLATMKHADQLTQVADEALYAAKKAGRNMVVTASD